MGENKNKIIKNTSEISIAEIDELIAQGYEHIIVRDGDHKAVDSYYEIHQFRQIKIKIDQFFKPIKDRLPAMSDREKFTYVYVKLALTTEYDQWAATCADLSGHYRELSEDYVNEANSLVGLMLRGKGLCRGYSETLRNLLSEVGIEASVIRGGGKTRRESPNGRHAWSQVCLDGVWYNCDITNDYERIQLMLKTELTLTSDKGLGEGEYNRFVKYPVDATEEPLHTCLVDMPSSEVEALINNATQIVQAELEQAAAMERARQQAAENKGFVRRVRSWIRDSLGKIRLNKGRE
ncbi:MAG: hypothetical protein E7378_04235 [Clostridiales bacterium]|nr:hypothetical protein [Clostridiales bacterium]